MIIVPTKKSLPLFTEFPILTTISSSTERSFFRGMQITLRWIIKKF